MTRIDLPYVNIQRDRNGRPYYYFRRSGRRWRLPGKPGSVEFAKRYRALLAATEPTAPAEPRAYSPGSFGALVLDYLASPEFRGTKPATQRVYKIILTPLVESHGAKPVALLERRHVKRWRDERAATPGMANMLVRVVSRLMAYAIDNEYRRDNPAARLKTFRLGEHRSWTDEELSAFEARWPSGTMERRAYALALHSGQRGGDLAAMTQAHRRDGMIRVIQEKTGADLWIPEHRDLTTELAHGSGHLSLLTKPSGSAFTSNQLTQWFAAAIDAAGLSSACVLHGLRKTAARRLAEVGCSAHEIMSITGHRTLKEVERYTRAADQRRLASAAIVRLERNENRTKTGKHGPRSSGKQKLKD